MHLCLGCERPSIARTIYLSQSIEIYLSGLVHEDAAVPVTVRVVDVEDEAERHLITHG